MEEVSTECGDNSIEINNGESINMEEKADKTLENVDENEISKDDQNGGNEGENIDEEHEDSNSLGYVLQISGLPDKYGRGKLYRHLTTVLQLDVYKLYADSFGSNIAYATFKKEKEFNRAMAMLNGYSFSGSVLKASESNWKECPNFLPKIGFLNLSKKFMFSSVEDRVENALLSLDAKSYETQMKMKEEILGRRCRSMEGKMRMRNTELANFTVSKKPNTNIMCDIQPMVESPLKEGFINKSIFSIGKNSEDEAPKVGYRIGNYEKKITEIGPYNHLKNLSDGLKSVANAIERFMAVSEHDPWEPFLETGVWRSCIVKTSRDGTAILTVQLCVEDLDEDQIETLKEDMINFFTNDEESTVKVTSFYMQRCTKTGLGRLGDLEFIGGQNYMDETILGQNFKVPPNSVHGMNTGILEILYEKVVDIVMEDSNSMVLNIYCDIGVIASKLIEKGRNVVSLESRALVAEQARENLGESATLLTGESEKTVEEFLNSLPEGESVTVVIMLLSYGSDKVRLLELIGKCDKVKRVVCVAFLMDSDMSILRFLNEEAQAKDLLMPVKVIPLDSEPYTYKYIGVVVFDRWACQDKATKTLNGVEVRKISKKDGGKFKGDLSTKLANRRRSGPSFSNDRKFGRPGLGSRGRGGRFQHSGPMPWNPRGRGGRFHPYGGMDEPNRYGESWGPRPSRPIYNNPPLIQRPPISRPNNYDEGYERGFMMAMRGFTRGRGGPGPRPSSVHSRLNLNSYRRY